MRPADKLRPITTRRSELTDRTELSSIRFVRQIGRGIDFKMKFCIIFTLLFAAWQGNALTVTGKHKDKHIFICNTLK